MASLSLELLSFDLILPHSTLLPAMESEAKDGMPRGRRRREHIAGMAKGSVRPEAGAPGRIHERSARWAMWRSISRQPASMTPGARGAKLVIVGIGVGDSSSLISLISSGRISRMQLTRRSFCLQPGPGGWQPAWLWVWLGPRATQTPKPASAPPINGAIRIKWALQASSLQYPWPCRHDQTLDPALPTPPVAPHLHP